PVFSRRVGEATVEVSGYFLSRVLGLTQHLNESHLVKQGMRFWFSNSRTQTLPDCSEIGGRYLARVPAYQVDRAVLDEEVLRRACALGAELLRPATVGRIQLNPGGLQTVDLRRAERSEQVQARWIVDASGGGALLARRGRSLAKEPALLQRYVRGRRVCAGGGCQRVFGPALQHGHGLDFVHREFGGKTDPVAAARPGHRAAAGEAQRRFRAQLPALV